MALGSWAPSRCNDQVLWVSVLGAPDEYREGEGAQSEHLCYIEGPSEKRGEDWHCKGAHSGREGARMPWSSPGTVLCWALQGAGSCWLQFGHETVVPEPWAQTTPLFPQAQIIAQAIGQAFSVAYQRFLEANSIDPSELSPRQYSRALEDQEQYNAELTHFSRQENCKDVRAALEGWG